MYHLFGLRRTASGKITHKYFDMPIKRYEAIAERSDLVMKKFCKKFGKDEDYNLFYTMGHTDHGSRIIKELEIIPLDIDGMEEQPDDRPEKKLDYLEIIEEVLDINLQNCTSIDSGNGHHLIMHTELFPAQEIDTYKFHYKELCDRINEAFANAGLSGRVDPSIWTQSRLLRMPSTRNIKPIKDPFGKDAVAKVASVVHPGFKKVSWDWTKFTPKVIAPKVIAPKVIAQSTVTNGKKPFTGKAIDPDYVMRECRFLAAELESGGSNTSEPLWYAALGITSYFPKTNKDYSYAVSYRHPGFTYQELDQKIEQAKQMPPRTCESISILGDSCKKCPWWGKVKTPLSLAPWECPSELEDIGEFTGRAKKSFQENLNEITKPFAEESFRENLNEIVDPFAGKIFYNTDEKKTYMITEDGGKVKLDMSKDFTHSSEDDPSDNLIDALRYTKGQIFNTGKKPENVPTNQEPGEKTPKSTHKEEENERIHAIHTENGQKVRSEIGEGKGSGGGGGEETPTDAQALPVTRRLEPPSGSSKIQAGTGEGQEEPGKVRGDIEAGNAANAQAIPVPVTGRVESPSRSAPRTTKKDPGTGSVPNTGREIQKVGVNGSAKSKVDWDEYIKLGFTSLKMGTKGKQTMEREINLLRQFFSSKTSFVNIDGLKRCMVFQDGYFQPFSREKIKAFAKQYYIPTSKRDHELEEFYKTVAISSIVPENFLQTTTEGLINLANGVLDIGTGKLTPHDPRWGFSYKLPYDYDKEAKCPTWDLLLANVTCGRKHLAAVLEEYLGYCVYGGPYNYNKVLIMFGEGANGKTTLVRAFQEVLGVKNCSSIEVSTMNRPFIAAGLEGKLANFSEEEDKKCFKETGILKRITGEGSIWIENKYEKPQQLQNKAKLIMTYNEMPFLNDLSAGMKRRLLILPFDLNLIQDPEKKIKDVNRKIRGELPGILNRALAGWQRLQNQDDFTQLGESDALVSKMEEFSKDDFTGWWEECIEVTGNKNDKVTIRDAFHKFKNETDNHKLNISQFGKKLKIICEKKGVFKGRISIGDRTHRGCRGIRISVESGEILQFDTPLKNKKS